MAPAASAGVCQIEWEARGRWLSTYLSVLGHFSVLVGYQGQAATPPALAVRDLRELCVPEHETTELWYSVQVQIEASCQSHMDLCGLSTDLVKAFNNLPRQPLLEVATGLGFPDSIICPWTAFLDGTSRHFLVHQCVNPEVLSTSGFPEGDPASPIAMLLADWGFHRYLQVYSPSVRSLSFVDNLAFTAPNVGILMQGYTLTECFCDMLDLELDRRKTFVWSTSSESRAALKGLGLTVETQARELGGVMSYGQATRNALLVKRCKGLQPLWAKLRRSKAPALLKIAVLPTKFWAKALHTIPGCPLRSAHLQQLRSAATAAINIRQGGSNAMIRLSEAANMEADPGFFELWHGIQTLRRMLQKQPHLLLVWREFMLGFDGCLLHGPLSKLIQLLSKIEWQVCHPPCVMDHDGLQHDLLSCPTQLLRRLLEQGWLLHVSHQIAHRKTMADVSGLDLALLHVDAAKLNPLHASLQSSLRSGAFIFGAQQAKFDLSQDGLCPHCQQPDDAFHRVCVCPHCVVHSHGFEWVCDEWPQLPVSLILPSRNPHVSGLHRLLHHLPDDTAQFQCGPDSAHVQHLFTDGACDNHCHPSLAIAAWGVTLGFSGPVAATSHLPGVLQTAPRAELTAFLAAVRWVVLHRRPTYIWVDAKKVVDGVWPLQQHLAFHPAENQDLWQRIQGAWDQVPQDILQVHHIPTHLDEALTASALTASPFEDWVAQFNGHVEKVASVTNINRPCDLVQIHQNAVQCHNDTLARKRALRSIYINLATSKQNDASEMGEEVETLDAEPSVWLPREDKPFDLEADLPLDWRVRVVEGSPLPADFLHEVFSFLIQQDADFEGAYRVSWLELVFVFECAFHLQDPFTGERGHWQSASTTVFRPVPPTVAGRLRIVRDAVRSTLKALHLEAALTRGLDLTSVGVFFMLDGLCWGFDPNLLAGARSRLAQFSAGRNMRSVAALARPL